MSVTGFLVDNQVQKYDYGSLDNVPENLATLNSPVFTGVPKAPTASGGTNTEQIATTAFVQREIGNKTISDDLKQALLQIANKVVYSDSGGPTYYNDLFNALYPYGYFTITNNLTGCITDNNDTGISGGVSYSAQITADSGYTLEGAIVTITMGGSEVIGSYHDGSINISNVTGDIVITVIAATMVDSISVSFTQGNRTIFSNQDINDLKDYITVTATYPDTTTIIVPSTDYTLSGSLSVGTDTITVHYGGKTDTFDVLVTAFVIPAGYTQYDYITRKNFNESTNYPLSHFIWLPVQNDVFALSTKAIIGYRTSTYAPYDGSGWFGARSASDTSKSYALYYQEQGGIIVNCHGIAVSSNVFIDGGPHVLEVDNPPTSPFYVKYDGETIITAQWENSFVLDAGFVLFNNVWSTATTNFAINRNAQIGSIQFRKYDGECVGYYIPCVYGGKIGMYDIITETFYTATTASAVTISNNGCHYAVGNW